MCFGRFLCPLPTALPLSMPGCIGFNPTQETDSFSQWEPTLAMRMLIRSPLMELGEQRMAHLSFQKISGVVIVTGKGGGSLRCYPWDHLGTSVTPDAVRHTPAWCWTLSGVLDATFTVAKRMPSLAKFLWQSHTQKPQRSWKKESF